MGSDLNSCRHLVLTVDYEVFGNGDGDVRRHIIEPMNRMARLCERYEVPLTVFFEVEEYLAFRRNTWELTSRLGYDPARLMREQAIDLAIRGHDLQLHLHPQWHGARSLNGKWVLRDEHWTVDDLFETQAEVTRYIAERKAVLDEMLSKSAPERKVRAYRAGAFSAQPGKKLLSALADNGILIDSSVVKGLYRSSEHVHFDYRGAPSRKSSWRVKENVARENPAGRIWEFPIHSVMKRRLHQATFSRFRAKFSKHVPKHQQRELVSQLGLRGGKPIGFLKFLWQPVPIKLDFHNVSPGNLLKWIFSTPAPATGEPDVLVLIGHTKEHIDDDAFEKFLRAVRRDDRLKIVTFDHLAKSLPDCAILNKPSLPIRADENGVGAKRVERVARSGQ